MRKNWQSAPLFRWAGRDEDDAETVAREVDWLVVALSEKTTEETAHLMGISTATICAFRSWLGVPRGFSPPTRASAMKEVKACWQAKRDEWKRLYEEYRRTMATIGKKKVAP